MRTTKTIKTRLTISIPVYVRELLDDHRKSQSNLRLKSLTMSGIIEEMILHGVGHESDKDSKNK